MLRTDDLLSGLVVMFTFGCASKADVALEPEPEPEPEPAIVAPKLEPAPVPEQKFEFDGPVPRGVPSGVPGGVPGGVLGGMPRGVPGGVPGGVPSDFGGCEALSCQTLPFEAVETQAYFLPDPDQAKLAAVRTADTPNPFEVRLGFCVLTNGKTTEIAVISNDPDPAVTKVVSDTVATWRFKPFIVDGKAITTCSERSFSIEFVD